MASLRVALMGRRLGIREDAREMLAVPSMEHPDFRRVLEHGWVSPPSFGPAGDLRIYSAAFTAPGEATYAWFASADWRRGRIQVDRQGAISDIAMAPYGGGHGRVRGERVELVLDYNHGSASLTVNEEHSALGKWTPTELALETDKGASTVIDAAFAVALFLWCARPDAFLVKAIPPFP